jgi:hypothetical protein
VSQADDDGGDIDGQHRPPADRLRLFAGGFGVLVAVLGFTAVQAAVEVAGYPEVYILLSMPVFGMIGFTSLAVFVTAFVPPEETTTDTDNSNGAGTK